MLSNPKSFKLYFFFFFERSVKRIKNFNFFNFNVWSISADYPFHWYLNGRFRSHDFRLGVWLITSVLPAQYKSHYNWTGILSSFWVTYSFDGLWQPARISRTKTLNVFDHYFIPIYKSQFCSHCTILSYNNLDYMRKH